MIEERAHPLPLAEHGFNLADISFPRVDGLGCVRVRTNLYSAPVDVGRTVEVRLYPSCVEIWHEGRCLARHERCYERNQQVLDLEHYRDVLGRKPGALIGSKPPSAWRQRGLWPESYDRLLAELISRHGKQSGTRQMIQVLSPIKPHGHRRLRAAIEGALALGCSDVAPIRHLAEAADLVRARSTIVELGALSRYERPKASLADYGFAKCPKISAQQIHELAKGDYIARAEPIIFIGDSGTGKTHLLTGLAVAACRQKRRVRFTTAAALINELRPHAGALGPLRSDRTG